MCRSKFPFSLSLKNSFNISCSVGLLARFVSAFAYLKKKLFPLLFWNIFFWVNEPRLVGSLSPPIKLSPHYLWVCIVSRKKSSVITICVPLHTLYFLSHAAFNDFFVYILVVAGNLIHCILYFPLYLICLRFIEHLWSLVCSFYKIWNIWVIILKTFFWSHLSFLILEL